MYKSNKTQGHDVDQVRWRDNIEEDVDDIGVTS